MIDRGRGLLLLLLGVAQVGVAAAARSGASAAAAGARSLLLLLRATQLVAAAAAQSGTSAATAGTSAAWSGASGCRGRLDAVARSGASECGGWLTADARSSASATAAASFSLYLVDGAVTDESGSSEQWRLTEERARQQYQQPSRLKIELARLFIFGLGTFFSVYWRHKPALNKTFSVEFRPDIVYQY
ncbi:uncharacterized protein LOC133909931 [Phragmites australis]|uniref:uncharacterized protein LOC133909931 n=1 Tax=Phragmites australis TaxID=29695 RepID=UPI002D7A0C65|nr:uncharacterized protein LOC133909931 [Phragmites australis]